MVNHFDQLSPTNTLELPLGGGTLIHLYADYHHFPAHAPKC